MPDEKGQDLKATMEDLDRRNRKMMFAVIALSLLAIVGTGGTAAYFLLFQHKGAEASEAASADKGAADEHATAARAETEEASASHGNSAGEAETDSSGEHKATSGGKVDETAMLGPNFVLEDLLINLDDDDGSRFLKTSLVVEAVDEASVAELQKRLPQLQDVTITLVSSKTYLDLQGADGKFRLREELKYRYNKLTGGKVSRIYFTKFIVQ